MIFAGIGGAAGAALRYLLGGLINGRMEGRTFIPAGTWVVNSIGSFLLGVLYSFHVHAVINEPIWILLGIGFCGAFTTFSTFGYETITLLQLGKKHAAVLYVISSVVICTAVAWSGLFLVNYLI